MWAKVSTSTINRGADLLAFHADLPRASVLAPLTREILNFLTTERDDDGGGGIDGGWDGYLCTLRMEYSASSSLLHY